MTTVTQKVTLTGAPETDAHIRRIHPSTHITCQSGGTERAHLWVTITCGTVTLPSLPLCVPCAELIGEAIVGNPIVVRDSEPHSSIGLPPVTGLLIP